MPTEKISRKQIDEGIRIINKLRKEAEAGSVSAIARYTGISRQTLYRWKKEGWSPSVEQIEAIQRDEEFDGIEGFRRRGRPLGSKTKNKSEWTGKKALNRALANLGKAMRAVYLQASLQGLTLQEALKGEQDTKSETNKQQI